MHTNDYGKLNYKATQLCCNLYSQKRTTLHNLEQNKCQGYFIYAVITILVIKASVTFERKQNI